MTTPLNQLLDSQDLERVRAPLEQAWTLPPAAYTDPRIFELERKHLFAKEWQCVAREEQLANAGDFVSVDLLDQPIVVARARDGQLRALSRVCLHRAMPVVEGSGNASRFVCPYHKWTYELSGELRSAPMMEGVEGFAADSCRLPQLALEVWQGFVFVSLDPDPAPLAPQLEALTKTLEPYGLADQTIVGTIEYDSPWNWKILVENFMEAYHHIGTHKESLEHTYPARDSSIDDNDGAPWVFLRMPGKHDGDGPPLFAACVFPTLMFLAHGAGGAWYQLEPTAHDQMRLRIHAMMPSSTASTLDEDSKEAVLGILRTVHEEDIEANLGIWQGLHSELTQQGRLSLYEKSIWQLNQLWLERLA